MFSMNEAFANEAWAHEAVFPHIHPHAQMSTAENLLWTLLFLCALALIVRIGAFVVTKFTRRNTLRD